MYPWAYSVLEYARNISFGVYSCIHKVYWYSHVWRRELFSCIRVSNSSISAVLIFVRPARWRFSCSLSLAEMRKRSLWANWKQEMKLGVVGPWSENFASSPSTNAAHQISVMPRDTPSWNWRKQWFPLVMWVSEQLWCLKPLNDLATKKQTY